MSGNSYLLGTNIVLYLLGGDKVIASILGTRVPHVSYITQMELLGSPKMNALEEKAIRRFLAVCIIVNMNEEIKFMSIQIRRKSGLKLPDSIIAATAEYTGLSLLTADKGFNKLKSLSILQYKKIM